MKNILFSVVLLLSYFVSSQVEFYLDDVLVDQSVIQQAEINNQQIILAFKNVGTDSVTWHLEQCQLNDDPNIEGDYVYLVKEFDVFGGIAFPYDYVTLPCWEMDTNSGWFIDLAVGERMMFTNFLVASGHGCEQFRYYVMEGSTVVDSIDVNYCSTLGVPENETDMINVYPVPANNIVTIDIGSHKGRVSVLCTSGELVLDEIEIDGSKTLSIIDLPAGVYLLQIRFENHLFYKRFIKFDE